MRFHPPTMALLSAFCLSLLPDWALAAAPTAEQALRLVPVQQGVEYDRPSAEAAAKCKMVAKKIDGHIGWIVESPEGVMLRKFIDTNDDGVVDQWSYYKDGLEVYRDIDSNFNGKVDQCRWFHTGGSRWGIDRNEDGVIDYWKQISAEEVTSEAVAAITARDADRFARLLLTPTDLRSLGLGKTRSQAVTEKVNQAIKGFTATVARQNSAAPNAVWLQFGASRPGVVPAGTDQSTKDMRVYENVTAIVDSNGKHEQVQIGTLVQVGDAWRLIPLSDSGLFFQASLPVRNEPNTSNAPSETSQKLLADLEKLDRDPARSGSQAEQAKYTAKRADLIDQIAEAAKTAEDRSMWVRQLADMLSAAVQSGVYPDGAERLEKLFDKLEKNNTDKNLAAYVKFRQLTAAYFRSMQAPKANFAKLQEEWLKTLEGFVSQYPTAPDAAEAMLQLAISQEFTGQEDEAKRWYLRISQEFPNASAGKKAAGAQIRLDSVGKTIELRGQSPQGGQIDLASYRGKVVLIQYWATWCAPAKADMATLKELWNKYGRSLAIVGVSLDNNAKDLNAYLADNPLPWPQIYEEGGLDSRPANALGILTVPTMILIDQQGKVVNRAVKVVDLESELKKLIR
ncbi:MAG: redoxin domain-containing protein [Planctomycetaceae bacterium]|nr:redoxin domain-containing protein [Planctomycetaceae bacterium]